jgi:hypothetical protein
MTFCLLIIFIYTSATNEEKDDEHISFDHGITIKGDDFHAIIHLLLKPSRRYGE